MSSKENRISHLSVTEQYIALCPVIDDPSDVQTVALEGLAIQRADDGGRDIVGVELTSCGTFMTLLPGSEDCIGIFRRGTKLRDIPPLYEFTTINSQPLNDCAHRSIGELHVLYTRQHSGVDAVAGDDSPEPEAEAAE